MSQGVGVTLEEEEKTFWQSAWILINVLKFNRN
jgi:hypothetical protein